MERSLAYLERRSNGEAVKAELWDDITDEHVRSWRTRWLPLIEQAVRLLKENNIPKEKWPQDLHWKWDKKTDWSRGYLSLHRFALTCEEGLQGLMLVNLTKLTGRLDSQKRKGSRLPRIRVNRAVESPRSYRETHLPRSWTKYGADCCRVEPRRGIQGAHWPAFLAAGCSFLSHGLRHGRLGAGCFISQPRLFRDDRKSGREILLLKLAT